MQRVRIWHPLLSFLLPFLLVPTKIVAQDTASRQLVVVSATAEIKVGTTVLATATKGQRFRLEEVQGEWCRVQFTANGHLQSGWIHTSQAQISAMPTKPDSGQDHRLTEGARQKLAEVARLYAKAAELSKAGRPRDAIPLAKQALSIRKQVFGEHHDAVAHSLYVLGTILGATGDYPAARTSLEQALVIRRTIHDKPEITATVLHNLGSLLERVGDNVTARKHYEEAVAIRRKTLGPQHKDTASSLGSLGNLLRKMNDYSVARQHLEEALTIRKSVLGSQHSDTAKSLNQLGLLLMETSDYTAARPCFEQALAILQQVYGEQHLATAELLNNLGSLLKTTGEYTAARPYLEQALAIVKTVRGDQSLPTATVLNSLGDLLTKMGDYTEAQEYFENSLAIRRRVLGEQHSDTATSLNNLGNLLRTTGNYASAQRYLEQSVAIMKAVHGQQHPLTAIALNNLGVLLGVMGEYAAARKCFEESLAIRRKVLGEQHADTATSLNNLGMLLKSMGNTAAAQRYFEQSVAIMKAVHGHQHPMTATTLDNLGDSLGVKGDYEGARKYLEESLAIRRRVLGEQHADTATSLNNLGLLLWATGNDTAARRNLEQAVAIMRKAYGEQHPTTATALGNLGLLLRRTGDSAGAANYLDQARRVLRRHIVHVLPGLSQTEQLRFLNAKDAASFHGALSLGWQQRQNTTITEMSAGWLLNGKAMAHEAVAQRTLLARESTNPAAAALLTNLESARAQLARQSLKVSPPQQQEALRKQLAELETEADRLTRQLGQLGIDTQPPDPWIELADVRNRIPAGAMLIDIARFKLFDLHRNLRESRWQPARYVAWIIPAAGAGDIRIVDLGDAAAIEADVTAVRRELQIAPERIRSIGEPEAERALRKPLENLARRILRPLLAETGDAKQLILSPDALLWLVPWSALPVGENRYAVEDYQISYVVSGRDLVTKRRPRLTRPPLLLADPDFGPVRTTSSENQRGAVSLADLQSAQRLPGTAAEAFAIRPSVQRYTGLTPKLQTGKDATEAAFRAVRQPKVLTISTHGFFLPDQEAKLDDPLSLSQDTRGASLTVEGLPLENPLLRCGLLLAGCNQRSTAAASDDDGMLTGLEIVGRDLRGTKLVVLSACDTGLGDVHTGEGVSGLRQAFQLAGAESIVATLWQVPDQETARLMVDFFEQLAAGQTRAASLQNAQLARIRHHRNRYGAAHPFFWGAATLTGDWK